MKPLLFLMRDSQGKPKRFAIRCNYSDKERVKKAGSGTARWSKTEKLWTIPPDPVLLKRMIKMFPDADLTPELDELISELYERQREIYLSSLVDAPISEGSKLFGYQNKSVRMLDTAGSLILGHRMGLGKTPIACAAVDYTTSRKVLVVCPSSVKWSWVDHMQEWAGRQDLYVLESKNVRSDQCRVIAKKRDEVLKDLLSEAEEFVIIMSYDMLRIHRGELARYDYDVIIFDEAHRLKNRKASTTQVAQEICKSVARKWLLTGTPVRNSYVDLYTLLSIIDPARFSSYWNFVNTYLETVPNLYGGTDIVGIKNEEEFNAMMSIYMYRLTQEDVYDELPETIYTNMRLPFEPEQDKIYKEMEKELLVAFEKEIEDGKTISQIVSAPNTIAQIMRLRQICLSPVLIGGPAKSAKLALLEEIVEDLLAQDEKFIIFSYFREFVKLIGSLLDHRGLNYGEIVGGQSSNDRHKVQQDFTNGEFNIIIGTAQSMGEGMNLQAAGTAIFTDLDWVPANNEQAEHRIGHRGGVKKEAPKIIRLYHPGTIEADIWSTCQRKEQVIDQSIGSAETIRNMILRNEK